MSAVDATPAGRNKPLLERQDAMNRKLAKERLRSNLETLACCCKPSGANGNLWPSGELLQSVEESVKVLIAEERKNPLTWKTLRRLNERIPALRLVSRVDKAVKHARERLAETGEAALDKLARQGGGHAQKLLRDLERIRNHPSDAKAIDWQQYESVLKGVARNQKLEIACGDSPASQKVICYARILELLVDDYRREPLRRQSRPLLQWLARIGHPQANGLLAFDYELANALEREQTALQEEARLRGRKETRDRVQRHREWRSGRLLYPGDWIRLRDAADFHALYGKKHALPKVCAGLEESEDRDRILKYDPIKVNLTCGRRLTDGFYYHRKRHVARCRDCQEAEWWAQGFEVVNGFPHGNWSLTTVQRIAEGHREAVERLNREQRWLPTPEGQQWLREANRKFVASLKEKARQEGWTQEQLRAEAKAYGLIR